MSVFRHYYPMPKNNPCQMAVPVLYYWGNLCWCGAMAAQLICNQWVAGSTPVTSSKKILRYTVEMAVRIVGFLLYLCKKTSRKVPCFCLIAQKMPCRVPYRVPCAGCSAAWAGRFRLRDLRAVWVWLLRVPDGVRRGLSHHKDECSVYRSGCALSGMDATVKQR